MGVPDKLIEIMEWKRRAIAPRVRSVSERELARLDASTPKPPPFLPALRRADGSLAVIAEIKRRSPSAGEIATGASAADRASIYQEAGADALSVLTDGNFFGGSLEDLRGVVARLRSSAAALPCLRKDFMVDEYQILEARAHRADAILLIAAALSDAEMKHFAQAAHGLELDVLVEVHTGEELDRVLAALGETGADAIGVNNRDLKSFAVSLETSLELADRIPPSVVRVAESGISTAEDMARLRAAGFDAFLIGESLMRQTDPGAALAALLAGTVATR